MSIRFIVVLGLMFGSVSAHAYTLYFGVATSHSDVESIGVPFGLIVSVRNEAGKVATDFNGPLELFVKWSVAPESLGPEQPLNCEFVEGICQTQDLFVFRNAQLRPVNLMIGDGPSGLIDVFRHNVAVTE